MRTNRETQYDIYESTVDVKDAPNLLTPGPFKEIRLITSKSDLTEPAYSPDGTRLSYLEDINVDGSPELYVYGFDGKSQTLLAWSANKKKSLSAITLPELDAAQSKGYRGGDEFALVEGIIARRFPVYPDDKPESKPTGKTRQIQYKLHAGEAGWLLKPGKVIEF